MDLSVEDDKLLVGDRPRQSYNPDAKIPLPERLAAQNADELSEVISYRCWRQLHYLTASQLTEDEVALFHYVIDLTNWLDPFHNFLRPRGEAAKPPPKNGNSSNDRTPANGHGRKPDDAPQITEPPDTILSYFKGEQLRILLMLSKSTFLVDAHAKLLSAVKASRPIYEILHIATLAQEASELSSSLVVADGADRHCFCSLFAPSASKMPPLSVSTNLALWVGQISLESTLIKLL